jgi:hypothetical protein
MALNLATLISGIQAAMQLGVTPPYASADSIASSIATTYDAYSRLAVSCAAQVPTVVNSSGCEAKFKEALGGTGNTAQQAATKWHAAVEIYWTGALFGVTGTVTIITGGPALITGLLSIFTTYTNTLLVAAQLIATQLDQYTRTVQVRDSLLPNPPGIGCGPSPIA